MGTRPSPDGKGIICDFSRAKCFLHGGKLRECGCPVEFVDFDWLQERTKVRMRRRGAVCRKAHERRVFTAMFGEEAAREIVK